MLSGFCRVIITSNSGLFCCLYIHRTLRRDLRLQQDLCQELGQGLSITLKAASGDCLLRLELSRFHAELESVTFSQQGGATLIHRGSGTGPSAQQEQPKFDMQHAGAGIVPAAAAAIAAAAAPMATRQRKGKARARVGSSVAAESGTDGGDGAEPAQPAALSAALVAAAPARGGAVAAPDDLGAVLARARALMAKTYATEEEEVDQGGQ
jgi:hypothetical protein